MLAAEKPRYVVVSSPPRCHAAQSIAAFQAGAHVMCEKPLCTSVAEAEAIVEAARQAGRLFTMSLQMRQNRQYRALRDFVAEGRLGRIYHTRVWGGHVMHYPGGRFHHRREQSLGGVIAATVVHPLDLAIWILGAPEPSAVSASAFRRLGLMPDPPIDFEGTVDDATVEDFAHAHVRFADGSSMSIEGNWLMHPTSTSIGCEFLGVLGVIRTKGAAVELEERSTVVPLELPAPPEPEDATLAQHEEFVAAIQGRGEPLVRFREALVVQRLLMGVYASERSGAEVRV
jgi:predicted dehydrogenase